MSDCVFCNIVSGKIPTAILYEDEKMLAFLDINPVNKGHTLVIPKEHYPTVLETPDEALSALILTAKKIAEAVRQGVEADGVNIIANIERAAGQLIYHTHIHIIPRFNNDGFRHWKGEPYHEREMEETAKKITLRM